MGCLQEAVQYLKSRIAEFPKTLVVLGSGLGGLAEKIESPEVIPYSEIPHMPTTRTGNHAGDLIVGKFGGERIAAFKGRTHLHDGYSAQEVAFGYFAMALCGVRGMLVTNAAGGIAEGFKVGDIMVIRNHLSLFLPDDPSRGVHSPALGPEKFYPQTEPYDKALRDAAGDWLLANQVPHQSGVYAFLAGPRYESAVDVTALRTLGADAVGMSTVPEVLAFRHALGAKARILGLSVITNVAAGLSESEPNDAEVQQEGRRVGETLCNLVAHLLPKFGGA